MRPWRLFLLLAILLAASAPADARMHYPARGHRIMPASAAPLDGFTAPSGAYSFRRLKSTYAGPAIRIRRASDNLETDINFLSCTGFTGCPWDEAAALAHCAATSCFVKTMYDQSGLGFDMTMATVGNQPSLVFNCWGALPCAQVNNNTFFLQAASRATTSPVSISGVAERTGGTGTCIFKAAAGANLLQGTNTVASQWTLAGTGTIVATAADAARHSFIGVIDGTASSVFRVDAAETTGTVAVITTANVWQMQGGATPTVCRFGEEIVWSGYGLTPAERAALRSNQRSFWGTP